MPRLLPVALLCLALLPLAGCGTDGPEVVEVKGRVTRNGQPVPNLLLTFMPESGRPSWAETNANGEFNVEYSREQRGAKVGNHKVWVKYAPSRPADPGQEAEMIAKGLNRGPPKDIAEIEAKYGSPEASTLKVEIKTWGQFVELKLD